MRGLSKRVRKKIYNDDYESKDVMDILEDIHYGVKVRFETKSTTQWVGYFETISDHFFGNYINIFHEIEV